MTEATARTITADILTLDIHEYAKRTARDQLELRGRLNAALASAIGHIAPADRIVVDTACCTAVVFLGAPGDALSAAIALRPTLAHEGDTVLPLRAALNRGPVQLAETGGSIGITGDGIAVAETLLGFAEPGQVVASRDFRDATGTDLSFQPQGTRTDAAVRAYEIFLLDPATSPASRRPSIRRRTVLVAAAVAALLIAGGFAAREAREIVEAQRRPGVIRLAVRPVGEVVVDGAYKGTAPPLKTLEVPAGRHTVELKRAGHPTRNLKVDLKPGEEIEIQHTFFERPRARSFWERLGL
jgi:class 3 adenylate cyclase